MYNEGDLQKGSRAAVAISFLKFPSADTNITISDIGIMECFGEKNDFRVLRLGGIIAALVERGKFIRNGVDKIRTSARREALLKRPERGSPDILMTVAE